MVADLLENTTLEDILEEERTHRRSGRRTRVAFESLIETFRQREAALDRDGTYAQQNVSDLRGAGLLGLNVPRQAGGMGADLSTTIETLRSIAQGSPSTALLFGMQISVLAHYLLELDHVPAPERRAFEEQRRWAWEQALEGKIFAVAVDYYLARNDGQSVNAVTTWDAVGMRGSESVVLRFTDAPVVGPLAYRGLLDGANKRHWSTLSFTAVFIGAAEALLEEARRHADGMMQKVETVNFHLSLQASRAFLRHCVSVEPQVPNDEYLRLIRDCKTFATKTLARGAADLFTTQSGRAYNFSSTFSRLLRDLLAGPALRPPIAIAFDEIWEDLSSAP